jgi:hypothetical protein
MNWNLVGSIYSRSSIKIAHFVPIRSQTWPPEAILVSDWLISKKNLLWNRLAKWIEGDNGKSYLSFNRRFFRNQPIRNKNCLWWPCLLTDQDKMSNLYRGPSIDASYQVLVHLAKWRRPKLLKERELFPLSPWEQTWGQLLSNVIDYITITLQFSWLHYIMITSIFKCNRLHYWLHFMSWQPMSSGRCRGNIHLTNSEEPQKLN